MSQSSASVIAKGAASVEVGHPPSLGEPLGGRGADRSRGGVSLEHRDGAASGMTSRRR